MSFAKRAAVTVPLAVMLGISAAPVRAGGAVSMLPFIMAFPGLTEVPRDDLSATRAPMPRLPAGPLPDGTPVARLVAAEAAAPSPAATEAPLPPATVPVAVKIDTPPTVAPVADNSAPKADAADSDSDAEPVVPPESLRDAIVDALKNNPDIQIALAQQDDARFAVDEARAGYLPHVDVTVGYGRELAKSKSGPTTQLWRAEGTASLNQNVWDFGTTINDIKRARASYRAARWGTRERIEAIAYDITDAYLRVLQQQKLIELTHQEIAATKKILRMVTVQKDLGLTTAADVERARARVENVQSTLLDRRSALQQARDAYKRLTNRQPGRAVDLPPSEAALPATVEAAVDMIDTHSPLMAQAVEDRKSLAKQYASQTGTFFPRVGLLLQGNHKYDVLGSTGVADDARAMVTVSYSFFNGGADIAVRRRIGARLREADYELDRRRRQVEQDIRADFEGLRAAREKIATISSEIAAAQTVADLYKQQFREGKRSVFDLLDSQQVLFNARSNEVVNSIAMHGAEYRVLQKLGGLFDLVSAGEPMPKLVVPAPGSRKK